MVDLREGSVRVVGWLFRGGLLKSNWLVVWLFGCPFGRPSFGDLLLPFPPRPPMMIRALFTPLAPSPPRGPSPPRRPTGTTGTRLLLPHPTRPRRPTGTTGTRLLLPHPTPASASPPLCAGVQGRSALPPPIGPYSAHPPLLCAGLQGGSPPSALAPPTLPCSVLCRPTRRVHTQCWP